MKSKETRKLLFFETHGSTNFSLFFREKREGLAFERLKFASSLTGPSATRGAVKLNSASFLIKNGLVHSSDRVILF